jgi:hypothetical protein
VQAAIARPAEAVIRKIVVTEFVSLDGVMEAPGGDDNFVRGAWTFKFPDPDGMQYKLDEVQTHDALLLVGLAAGGFQGAGERHRGPHLPAGAPVARRWRQRV